MTICSRAHTLLLITLPGYLLHLNFSEHATNPKSQEEGFKTLLSGAVRYLVSPPALYSHLFFLLNHPYTIWRILHPPPNQTLYSVSDGYTMLGTYSERWRKSGSWSPSTSCFSRGWEWCCSRAPTKATTCFLTFLKPDGGCSCSSRRLTSPTWCERARSYRCSQKDGCFGFGWSCVRSLFCLGECVGGRVGRSWLNIALYT